MFESSIYRAEKGPDSQSLKRLSSGISTDWYGDPVAGAVSFLYWLDDTRFHFLVRVEGSPGLPHPSGKPGSFQAELWKYDVAEFFLQSPDRSQYLEFNLAPNGAWWSCLFRGRLVPAPDQPRPFPGVRTSARQNDQSWEASASFPRELLEELFPLDQGITLNTTFILESPRQRFLTAADLGEGDPDFHRPDQFPPAKLLPLA